MSCNNSCNKQPVESTCCQGHDNRNSFVIIIVLYILLAIIIGSCLF